MLAVRKKPKAYGAFANEYVEGPYEAGQHVLLLEDVVTNGRDLLAARFASARARTESDAVRRHQPRPRAGARAHRILASLGRSKNRELNRKLQAVVRRASP